MRFWDASAVVPLCVEQPVSAVIDAEFAADPAMIVWWATPVECASAVARLARAGKLEVKALDRATSALERLRAGWFEVQPASGLRDRAIRLLRVHDLRAADALQLAAALEWSDPPSGELLTFHRRLAAAARLEGFALPDLST